MFTGIVEELGTVLAISRTGDGARLELKCQMVLSDLINGGSVCVNGVCLTALDLRADGFGADLAPETMARTNLGKLREGDRVNLERPVTPVTRLSGHIVQGHVDCTGVIESIRDMGEGNHEVSIQLPGEFDRYLVYKGSITIDGISLTVAQVDNGVVRVAIIPHTWEATSLAARKPGDHVNIECDVLAKHVEKLLSAYRPVQSE
jgi:riboflavin synthase